MGKLGVRDRGETKGEGEFWGRGKLRVRAKLGVSGES